MTTCLLAPSPAAPNPIHGGEVSVTAELVDATLATAAIQRPRPRQARRRARQHRRLPHRAVPHLPRRSRTPASGAAHPHEHASRTRVPSRLRETAAWLLALDPDRNGWLVDVDPDTVAAHAGLVNVPASAASWWPTCWSPRIRN